MHPSSRLHPTTHQQHAAWAHAALWGRGRCLACGPNQRVEDEALSLRAAAVVIHPQGRRPRRRSAQLPCACIKPHLELNTGWAEHPPEVPTQVKRASSSSLKCEYARCTSSTVMASYLQQYRGTNAVQARYTSGQGSATEAEQQHQVCAAADRKRGASAPTPWACSVSRPHTQRGAPHHPFPSPQDSHGAQVAQALGALPGHIGVLQGVGGRARHLCEGVDLCFAGRRRGHSCSAQQCPCGHAASS